MFVIGWWRSEGGDSTRRPEDVRTEKERARKPSLRDIEPVSVGRILQPLGTRDEWYDEMREGRA